MMINDGRFAPVGHLMQVLAQVQQVDKQEEVCRGASNGALVDVSMY